MTGRPDRGVLTGLIGLRAALLVCVAPIVLAAAGAWISPLRRLSRPIAAG